MKIYYSIFIVALMIMVSCRPSTEVTAVWNTPEPERSNYNSIFLAALTEDLSLRQNLEQEFASRLTNRNVTTTKSVETFRPDFYDERSPERNRLEEIIRETACEGILTITLIDVEQEERFVPGGAAGMGGMYQPMGRFGYYGTFPGYFNHWHGAAFNTGYYSTDRRYFMETNLYDAQTMELVWSAQSKTLNPASDAAFAREYVDAVKAELRENGLVQ
ncbi:hypothetical protein [Anditalea andensis]|uniref:DUF4136 domain-containing protein n=1 Tax=Anditalea andensis TaxID=1048983 RepID=A0A074L069_9BACT|nr:hypothetical protein [Anditalea andensis]KEO73890.1 hypothetical protein EL17_10340 [Anditalea andensis]